MTLKCIAKHLHMGIGPMIAGTLLNSQAWSFASLLWS